MLLVGSLGFVAEEKLLESHRVMPGRPKMPHDISETLKVNQFNVLKDDNWKIPKAKTLHKIFNVRK